MVDPTTADGVFTLLWLVVAPPLAGAAILLMAAGAPTGGDTLLGTALPIGLFVISWSFHLAARARDDERQVMQHLLHLVQGATSTSGWTCSTTSCRRCSCC